MSRTTACAAATLAMLALATAGIAAAQAPGRVQTLRGEQAGEFFGRAIAVDGDILAVGAPTADGELLDEGTVYVFRRSASGWSLESRLTAPAPGRHDFFGYSVAVRGSLVAVGAPRARDGGRRTGRVYLYEHAGGGWRLHSVVSPVAGENHQRFGSAVALSGAELAVGAHRRAPGREPDGALHLFRRSGTAWLPDGVLRPDDGSAARSFCAAVALGRGVVVGGAIGADGRVGGERWPQSGAAYAFHRRRSHWSESYQVAGSLGRDGDRLGGTLALHGKKLLIGGDIGSGRVYLFTLRRRGVSEEAVFEPGDGIAAEDFGQALALRGSLVVAGSRDSSSEGGRGAVYLFREAPGGWVQVAKLRPPGPDQEPFFGRSVALSSSELFVGSPWREGAVHVYR